MEPVKSKQISLYFLLDQLLELKCLLLGFVRLFLLPLGICTLDLLWTPLGRLLIGVKKAFFTPISSSPCWTKNSCFFFLFLHKVILFLRRLTPPYRILNSEDLPVRFRLVHCSPRLHAPFISIPGPIQSLGILLSRDHCFAYKAVRRRSLPRASYPK